MPIKPLNTTDTLKTLPSTITSKLFILQYSELFNRKLSSFSESTKHIIKNNKELNDLYDLFLDFIIDSSQYLEYTKAEKNKGTYAREEMEAL